MKVVKTKVLEEVLYRLNPTTVVKVRATARPLPNGGYPVEVTTLDGEAPTDLVAYDVTASYRLARNVVGMTQVVP